LRLKPQWSEHLAAMRERELGLAFAGCLDGIFEHALELGCGNGFQARRLLRWVAQLVSTDADPRVVENERAPGLRFVMCKAEDLDRRFPDASFDLVFSSSALEHVHDLPRALAATRAVLKDDGVAVHVVPNPFWKLSSFLLHFPNLAALAVERATSRRQTAPPRGHDLRSAEGAGSAPSALPRPGRWSWLWPEIHGVSGGHVAELRDFRESTWRKRFALAGFRVLAVRRGPVASGHGLGLDRARAALERRGFSSVNIFICEKADNATRFRSAFGLSDAGSPRRPG
jgi:SAM-dependent methyltransferase